MNKKSIKSIKARQKTYSKKAFILFTFCVFLGLLCAGMFAATVFFANFSKQFVYISCRIFELDLAWKVGCSSASCNLISGRSSELVSVQVVRLSHFFAARLINFAFEFVCLLVSRVFNIRAETQKTQNSTRDSKTPSCARHVFWLNCFFFFFFFFLRRMFNQFL